MSARTIPADSLSTAQPLSVMPDEPVVPLSVEAYHALLRAGMLQDGDPIELLEGFLVPKTTRGSRHELVRRRLFRRLRKLISDDWLVDTQGSTTLIDSEPEPDVFVIRGTEEDYPDRHAGPEETELVAEIADTSLGRDRTMKQRVYARAKVPVYWIVNLIDDCVEVYTQPSGPGRTPKYKVRADYGAEDKVPVIIEGRTIGSVAVADLLARSK